MEFSNKQDLIVALKKQIGSSDNQAIKALMKIYANQTTREQTVNETIEENGIGFSSTDANFLTSLAKQYSEKGVLSERQMSYLKKVMPKYSRQLINMSLDSGLIYKINRFYEWDSKR